MIQTINTLLVLMKVREMTLSFNAFSLELFKKHNY